MVEPGGPEQGLGLYSPSRSPPWTSIRRSWVPMPAPASRASMLRSTAESFLHALDCDTLVVRPPR